MIFKNYVYINILTCAAHQESQRAKPNQALPLLRAVDHSRPIMIGISLSLTALNFHINHHRLQADPHRTSYLFSKPYLGKKA